MTKQRELTESEQAAHKNYGGLARRQYNAKHSKFAAIAAAVVSGSFEVAAVFEGNPMPQTAPFPNESAALARFEKLISNPNALKVWVVQHKRNRTDDGTAASKTVVLYSFERASPQEFANSTVETLWMGDKGTLLNTKAVKKSPAMYEALLDGKLQAYKRVASGGNAWWEHRA